jgi:hypothetical protein
MLSRKSARPVRTAWLTAAALLLVLAAPAQAQWKWRDARGQIHISDIPPPKDIPEKDVLQRAQVVAKPAAAPAAPAAPASAASATLSAKAPVDPALEERRRQAEQQQAARSKAEETKLAAQRKENCQRARDHLALLDSGQRIAHVKADGEREILDDQQRAAETKRTREAIAADCR